MQSNSCLRLTALSALEFIVGVSNLVRVLRAYASAGRLIIPGSTDDLQQIKDIMDDWHLSAPRNRAFFFCQCSTRISIRHRRFNSFSVARFLSMAPITCHFSYSSFHRLHRRTFNVSHLTVNLMKPGTFPDLFWWQFKSVACDHYLLILY